MNNKKIIKYEWIIIKIIWKKCMFFYVTKKINTSSCSRNSGIA